MITLPEEVILENARAIDSNVILGYITGRQISSLTLHIGRDASIRSGTIIYAGTKIGERLETGHNVVIREENSIGDDFEIWSNSIVDYGCQIGNDVKIHSNVYVAQFTQIDDDVFLAPGVTVANDPHPLCGLCMDEQAPKILRGARIGVNVTILPGVTIGEHALIGAGSVVTKDVPARSVFYGNPARMAGFVDDLSCIDERVEWPYINGVDVKAQNHS